ncbi:MAG TPA: cytochrome c oxidase subunit II [Caldilineaceae bacterium]|nr:cytochrome c oxidase subunit II [Caldilineaceae bacterium]
MQQVTPRLAGLLSLCYLTSCAAAPSVIAPRGPAAESIANLWWTLLAVGMAVYVAVMAFLFYALFRRRRADLDLRTPVPRSRVQVVVWAGIIVPALILLGVHGLTLGVLRILAEPETPPALTIQVIGHQWWWEVRYPEYNFETANEIHIPVGQPVAIELVSDDVIHSFWAPELHGKLDLNPGLTNHFWLQADVPGAYWGECAEFCGVQHAKMQFVVVAEPVDEFAAWVEQQRRPAQVPADPQAQRGLEIFLGSECIYCHTVAGTGATGNLGPDLTHLASRRTLAAGAVANNRGNLGGWITDPQHIKPGSLMPPTDLTGADLQALLAYLATLE